MFKKKSTFKIRQLEIVVDHEDLERLNKHKWHLWEARQQLLPYTDVGRPGQPVYLPLPNFLLNVDNGVFIERRDISGADFRKANLKVRR